MRAPLRSFKALLALPGYFILIAACPQAPALQPRALHVITQAAEHARRTSGAPSIVVGIARCDVVLYERAFGESNVAKRIPAQADTQYEIGSITKEFTAAALLLLVSQKRVALDVPVSRYLPSAPHAADVTVRELLDHTSGLPDYTGSAVMINYTGKPYDVEPDNILQYIGHLPLEFTPGTQFAYSNTNYVVLGKIIEAVSGEPYSEYLLDHVLKPSGLHHTAYTLALQSADHAVGYLVRNAAVPTPIFEAGYDWLYAAGALSSNVPDLLKWQRVLFAGALLPSHILRMMTSPQRFLNGTTMRHGLGIDIQTLDGEVVYLHTGGIPGFTGEIAYLPKSGITIAILSNSYSAAPIDLTRRIIDVLKSELFE